MIIAVSYTHLVSNALRLKRFKPYYQKENKKMKKEIEIDGMMCQMCKKHVEEALNNLADTTATAVSYTHLFFIFNVKIIIFK